MTTGGTQIDSPGNSSWDQSLFCADLAGENARKAKKRSCIPSSLQETFQGRRILQKYPPFPVLMFSSQSVVFPGNCGQCLPPTKKFPCPPPPTKAHFKKKPGNDCQMSATRNEVRFFPYFSISLLFQTSFDISTAGRRLKMAGSRGKHGRYSGLLNPEEDGQPCRRLSYRESSWQPKLEHIYR